MLDRLAIGLFALSLAACSQEAAQPQDMPHDALPAAEELPGPADGVYPSMMRSTASIVGIEGTEIGTANLLGGPNGLLIRVEIAPSGLTPGWHGLHLHAVGDCSDIGTFKASGGHVGMVSGGHGLLNPKGPEGGDIPNIWAGADGAAGYEAYTTLAEMAELLDEDGSAILIHESEDDHMTQPIGGAGARVACGVIK
ncbi:superoxide dismutase family protein [Hyphomonas sp.]|uniref:superoxide dismutase family protein n=1 Tax=Hyphomonas sp. TaxID=87 RepID=UPI003D278687|tara:strand:- start:81623 stop:82210 length:588 start_codon:yes stop_codon:yes gene_type:complete